MKNVVFVVGLLALASLVSADNLFFKVTDSDVVDANIKAVNITNAEILICVYSSGSFTAGGGTGGGGGGGGGAGGEGDGVTTAPSTASSGCLRTKTNSLGEASFNIEYRGLDQISLWYTIQKTGYKNATGIISMTVQGIPTPSMGSITISRPILDIVTNDLSKSTLRWEGLTLDLTQIILQRNPLLAKSLYQKCNTGRCSYASQTMNVSMQQTGNTFRLRWGDIFPACAADRSRNVDTVRCAAEFLVPNLHLQSMTSLLWQMVLAIFRFELSIQGLFDWVIGILTPLLIIALIFIYEVMKTYLLFALTYLSWATLISVLVNTNVIKAETLAWLIPVTVLAILAGTMWLIGTDVGLWRPLIIF